MEVRSESKLRLPHEQDAVDEEKKKAKRKKIYLQNAPFIAYEGNVFYHTTFVDCAEKGELLLKAADSVPEPLVLGFDMEWPFNFQTGPGKSAVIQISSSLEDCHILHVTRLKNLPRSVTELLVHPKVILTGINIKNDIKKLAKDFKGIDVEKAIANCVDLGLFANRVLRFRKQWSMQKLVEHCLELRINKDKSVRCSKWHVIPLSKDQQVYAAIDAYASLKLYMHIKKLECEMEKENIID